MKRVLFLVPKPFTYDDLNADQQEVIDKYFFGFVIEAPGTKAKGGLMVCDAICVDSFDPDMDMKALGIHWPIIGLWKWTGRSDHAVETLIALENSKYLERLNDKPVFDNNGNQTGTIPPVLEPSHEWMGWPPMF